MNTIFNTIGGVMTTIICYIVKILPGFSAEEKEAMKSSIQSSKLIVGIISLVAMLVAIYVLPMLGLNKLFKKATKRRRRKTNRKMRRR